MLRSWLLPSFSTLALVPLGLAAPLQDDGAETLWIRAERLIVRPGEELEDAALLVEDGRIVAVGKDVAAPEGARELEAKVACAGFVDAWSSLTLEPRSRNDLGTLASTRTVDGLDPYRLPFLREEALLGGVTTRRVQAGDPAPIGGLGAVVRTDPRRPEVLSEEACVAASVGITRSGRRGDVFDRVEEVERLVGQLDKGRTYGRSLLEYEQELAEWEKAIAEKREELEDDFKKAKKKRDKEIEEAKEKGKEFKEERYKEDKKPKQPRWDPNSAVLARVTDGELPLIVQAHRVPELRGLLTQTEGFERLRLVVAGATEASHVAAQLAERRIPVLLWPTFDPGNASEFERHDLGLAATLDEAGVEVLFGSGGNEDARDLRLLAAQTVAHGLDRDAALHALTLGPARAFDVADRVGSLERGKHADVLLFDGDPLDTNARLQVVVSRGRVVAER